MLCIRCSNRERSKTKTDGLCALCRHAFKRNPDVIRRPWQDGKKGLSVEDRFWSHVDKSQGPEGCWLWTARLDKDGYGQFRLNGTSKRAHRVAYELETGETLTPDIFLDHTCHDETCAETLAAPLYLIDPYEERCPHRNCVNPKHLEPVTNRTNVRRGQGYPGANFRKTECSRGHQFTPENTLFQVKGRSCLICHQLNLLRKYPNLQESYPDVAAYYTERAS